MNKDQSENHKKTDSDETNKATVPTIEPLPVQNIKPMLKQATLRQ